MTKTLASERHVDFAALRREFPIFERKVHGKPLIYLDSTATTQKPLAVLEALDRYYRTYNANIHRGVYLIAEEATQAYEDAREKVARFLNARSSKEIVFTRGTTESVNLVSHAWGRKNVGRGDVIVLTEMEHHSNLVPWQLLATERGATIRYIPVDGNGRLDLSGLDRLLQGPVKIVSLAHVSNVLGTINPVAEIARRAHAAGAVVMVDGAQSVPHMPVDVRALDCDFLALSGHKMLAPTGIGALYGKRELLEAMPPFFGGGEMIREVRLEGSTWNDVPFKFEAGTMNIADTIAFGAAIDYLSEIGMEAVHAHGRELVEETMRVLGSIPGVTIYGPPAAERGGIVPFTVDDIHAHDVAAVLDHEGVAVRAGHHCAMPLHTKLGLAATTRASFYVYNLISDVERLGEGVRKAKQVFHR
ncbi:MAG: cysteine desulfurase [Candidatus Eisenbacteria bacterium]|uniref:Cysteine desulfurase n=1 Tax=Eiseniibacteriota bacterium TaxID=2212470 RepID=A0A538TUX8_UNCEI|nr:MAG: cysteine desulfurase [Candidatus Eisenbacteria bacterium]